MSQIGLNLGQALIFNQSLSWLSLNAPKNNSGQPKEIWQRNDFSGDVFQVRGIFWKHVLLKSPNESGLQMTTVLGCKGELNFFWQEKSCWKYIDNREIDKYRGCTTGWRGLRLRALHQVPIKMIPLESLLKRQRNKASAAHVGHWLPKKIGLRRYQKNQDGICNPRLSLKVQGSPGHVPHKQKTSKRLNGS